MKPLTPADLKIGDIIAKDEDVNYVIIAAFPTKVVAQHTVDLLDLTGWQKVDLYMKTVTK